MAKAVLAISEERIFAGYVHQRVGKRRHGREIILGHAHHLVVAAIGGDLHPVIFEQLEANFAFGQQAHQFQQFLGGNGARAFLFYFRFAGGADAQFQIGGGEREAVALGLAQAGARGWEWWFCARRRPASDSAPAKRSNFFTLNSIAGFPPQDGQPHEQHKPVTVPLF